jgi:hypothetical protein
MAYHPVSDSLGNPYIGVLIAAIIIAVAIGYRLYRSRRSKSKDN